MRFEREAVFTVGKKKSVPARQHHYVKRENKFIDMPKDQLIKLCVTVVAVIAAIILAFVLWNALDGHLDIVDGKVVTAGDNWIIANTRTASNPKYFKIGEVGEVEGFERTVDSTSIGSSNQPGYSYMPEENTMGIAGTSIFAAAGDYDELATRSASSYASFGEVGKIDKSNLAGKKARVTSYAYNYETPESEQPVAETAETDVIDDSTPETDAAETTGTDVADTAVPEADEHDHAEAPRTYVKGMSATLKASHNHSIFVSAYATADAPDTLPSDEDLRSVIEKIAEQITID